MFKKICADLSGFVERDPAAPNRLLVVFLWPGFHAVFLHRIAHFFWKRKLLRVISRCISAFSRFMTLVDIHPAAQIDSGFVIDHGAGVVIGETAKIGKNVTLYHGVTLGGVSPSVNSASQIGMKRHPTIGDDVIIGSGAAILGSIYVGNLARIGSNAVVNKDVPDQAIAVGNPARFVFKKDSDEKSFRPYGLGSTDFSYSHEELSFLQDRIEKIEKKLLDQ